MKSVFAILLLAGITSSASGAVFTYDEDISGDISNDYLNPLVFTPTAGISTLRGSISADNRDLFTIVVASGTVLDSIRLLSYVTSPDEPRNLSFLLVQPGATLSEEPNDNFEAPIGFTSFGAFSIERDLNLLPIITAGPPFFEVTQLEAGSYAFWINETGPTSRYEFAFNITAVPEPSALTVALLATFPLVLRRRRTS
jgi:hypothetical protein